MRGACAGRDPLRARRGRGSAQRRRRWAKSPLLAGAFGAGASCPPPARNRPWTLTASILSLSPPKFPERSGGRGHKPLCQPGGQGGAFVALLRSACRKGPISRPTYRRRAAKGVTGRGPGGTARRALCSEPLPSPARQSPAAAWAGAVVKHGHRSMEAGLGRGTLRGGAFAAPPGLPGGAIPWRRRGCGLRQREARRAEARSRRPNHIRNRRGAVVNSFRVYSLF